MVDYCSIDKSIQKPNPESAGLHQAECFHGFAGIPVRDLSLQPQLSVRTDQVEIWKELQGYHCGAEAGTCSRAAGDPQVQRGRSG